MKRSNPYSTPPRFTPNYLHLLDLAIISDEISLDPAAAIRLGKELGFHKYEIRCLDDYAHRVPDFLPGRSEQLEEWVRSDTIEVTALSPGTFKIKLSDIQALRRQMDEVLPKCCQLAVRLGAPRIITFAFLREAGSNFKEVVARLREAAVIAGAHNLELSVENEPGAYGDTGVNTARLVEAVDLPHAGINWDPANAVYAGEAAYPVGYEAVLPFLQSVHLKDGIPLPPDKWENRLLGDGGVNYIGQLRALQRDQPVPHWTMETHVEPLLESTRENLRRLRILQAAAREFQNPPHDK